MTAETFTANAQRRVGTLGAYRYATMPIDSTADTALANITTSSSVRDVLVILDANIERYHTVGTNSNGGATSILYGNPPTDIAHTGGLSNGDNGSSTAVTVGTLSATSSDPTISFTLVSGSGNTNNGEFAISGTTLSYTGGAVSTNDTKAFRIRATDSTGQTFEEAMSITVTA